MGSTLEAEAGAESPAHRPLVYSVWGKGGVGKSTIASALALLLSRRGLRTALVSTDPFPSIVEVLGGGEPGEWSRVCGIDVLVVTEELAAREWRRELGDQVYQLFSTLFDVDRETLLEYLSQAPWVLEQYYILIVARASRSYDAVVWDTAGAGGGILMLHLEEKLYRHLRLAPRIYSKLRLRGGASVDRIVSEWLRLAEEALDIIHSPSHHPLLVVDVLSGVYQLHLAEQLERLGVYPKTVVVNRVLENETCNNLQALCEEARRVARGALALAERLGAAVATLPLLAEPPRGCQRLERLADYLEAMITQ